MKKHQKIVITGGPGTGKTTLINFLKERKYQCFPEISRTVTQAAQQEGIEQLFLKDPLLFSSKLLKGRINQFKNTPNHHEPFFFDRGIPDTVAYHNYSKDTYPSYFTDACKKYRYQMVFILPPWETIYTTDNERYETFEQAKLIYNYLKETYCKFGYTPIEVPRDTVKNRAYFILNCIQ